MSNGIRSMIASLLCCTLLSVFVRPALGQSPPVPQALRIVVVADDEALLQRSTVHEPTVEVEDENNMPVAGAIVVFTAPSGSGEFMNGARSLTVATNQQGRAKAAGFRANNQGGEFVLQVLATFQALRAETTIRQETVSASASATDESEAKSAGRGHAGKWILIGGVVAVGALVGALAAGRGSSSTGSGSTPTVGVTITPGAGTVGAPPK